MKDNYCFFKRIKSSVLFFFLSLPLFSQVQLLNDGDFENSSGDGTFPNSGYWTSYTSGGGSGALCTTTAKHNGDHGLWEYTGIQTWATWCAPYQEFAASTGKVFFASGWIRTPQINESGSSWIEGSKACIRIEFLNSGRSTLAIKESAGVTTIASDWAQYNITSDPAPTGTAFVRYSCYIEKPVGTYGVSVANFDDCFFSEVASLPAPEFNLLSGTYIRPQEIIISCDTADAIIYYTINGEDPTESSTVYNGPFSIDSSVTIKAYAYKTGWNPSGIAIANYDLKNVLSVFSASPVSGPAPLSVQFEDESLGSILKRIWYFGDGETSTSQNPLHIYKSVGIYPVSLTVFGNNENDTKTHKDYIYVAPPMASSSVDKAYSHLKEQFDQFHSSSYVYKDDVAGGNIFVPSIWQGEIKTISINQSSNNDPFDRSCTEISFPLESDTTFSSIKYVYPDQNIGSKPGFNLSGATELSFFAKGTGTVEFMLGGMNRKPFNTDSLDYSDGVDIRSSGFIKLKNEWEYQTIDLTDDTFWVYLDSDKGLNNRFLEQAYMGNTSYFDFNYGEIIDGSKRCMKLSWFGGSIYSGGIFLLPPECNLNSTKGYDLSGITKIHFKARISDSGNVKFLFGKAGDSSGSHFTTLSLNTAWQWYEWQLPSGLDYSNIVGGFGFYFGGDLNTPNSDIYIDSVYYEGVKLASDFSHLICGFAVSANKSSNPEGVTLFIDEIKYNCDRTKESRFCQSFVCGPDSIDKTLKNRADTYDNALKLIADLAQYNMTSDSTCLNDAKLVGDAFIYSIQNDRFFDDNRLRNSYMSGEIANDNHKARVPGWWDDIDKKWYEDIGCVSTSTGNVAWAGLALITLFDITNDRRYLTASENLADWCIDNAKTDNGFTGGYTGWGETGQEKIEWKSTEHNIDLYALFTRLYHRTSKLAYKTAAINSKNFVLSMWNSTGKFFWTGTTDDGHTLNEANLPIDIQAWYIMAFRDSTSTYSDGINWANTNCYLGSFTSPNYNEPLNGYDFNTDLDGIWFEGTSQAVLANKMKGNQNFTEPVLEYVRYVQNNNSTQKYFNFNSRGIVAADHDRVSTGFEWNYNNRLHIGATAWFIFAELGINPYYLYDNLLPLNLPVQDTTIHSGESLCYNAYDSVSVAGNSTEVVLESGSEVTYIAGRSIRFLPGFRAQPGCIMNAHITTDSTFCDQNSASVMEQTSEEDLSEKLLTQKNENIQVEKSFKIYPVPNYGQFTIELTNIETGATLSIYNIFGEEIFQSKVKNQTKEIICLPGLCNGIYFVRINDRNEQCVRKMIVN